MDWKVSTAVVNEPVSLAEVKLHLRLASDDTEDSLLESMITAAREAAEQYTGRALATQTIALYLDDWPAGDYIELRKPPVQSVTSVKYKNSAGTETTMTVTTDYIVDTDSQTPRIVLPYGEDWPSFTAYPVNPITITYVAGYTTVPRAIAQAILLLVGYMYNNRDDVQGDILNPTVKNLLSPYKHRGFD